MSIEAMTWVLRNSEARLGARLVLLALADYAHADGSEAYPSVDTLAANTRLSRRAVQTALRTLQDDGEIVEDGKGRKGTTCYRLTLGGAESARGAESDGAGAQNPTPGGADSAPNPSKEPSKDPSGVVRASDLRVSYRGKQVPQALLGPALLAVESWAQSTRQTLRALDGQGKPTDSLKRVIGAMQSFPEVIELWPAMIRAALARPWWEGTAPGVGVVFGPRVVERMIEQAKRGPGDGGAQLAGDGPKRGGPSAGDFAELARLG